MTNNSYDVGIIGAGVAGAFACSKLAKENKNFKTIVFDIGRPPMKRRRQLEGWLGCLPNSDGKLYMTDVPKIGELVGSKRATHAYNFVAKHLSQINKFKITQDKGPSAAVVKKINKNDYKLTLNDYIQLYPNDIHALSKYTAETLENYTNLSFSFDNEVRSIFKNKNDFTLVTDNGEVTCKKVILAVGRSGWRWVKDLFQNFDIIDSNDTAKFGIRLELSSSYMKDFNKSSCTITKDDVEIGPLSWYGTVIPEDHLDVAISAFRSNENRWKTDKVSFNFIGNKNFEKSGFEQTDRLSKLTFVLSNDRILKEKVSYILNDKSKISIIPEYNWLKEQLLSLESIMPDILDKSYFHVPTINTTVPKINIGTNLETEIEGLFVAGETTGVSGILAASVSGVIVADQIWK